jgi:hypothetical protein
VARRLPAISFSKAHAPRLPALHRSFPRYLAGQADRRVDGRPGFRRQEAHDGLEGCVGADPALSVDSDSIGTWGKSAQIRGQRRSPRAATPLRPHS